MEDLLLSGRLFQLQQNTRTSPRTMEEEEAHQDGASLLDSHLIESDAESRTLPIVRVLSGVMTYEFMAWTATLLITVSVPQFINPDGALATACLVVLLVGLFGMATCYGIMVQCRRHYRHPPIKQFMVALHVTIAAVCVCSAVLIHQLATMCFVLMVWAGALVMLLKLNNTPTQIDPPQQLVLLTVYSSILVCFVCVAQELTFKDVGVNLLAFILNVVVIAFRYDWLTHHALASDSTYNITETDRAWFDLYTWTVDERVMERLRQPKLSSFSSSSSSLPYANEEL